MNREMKSLIANVLAGIAIGFGICTGLHFLLKPSCPTEDSCTVDYRDGEWHIEETTP